MTIDSKNGVISEPKEEAIEVRHSRAVLERAERIDEQSGTISNERSLTFDWMKEGDVEIKDMMWVKAEFCFSQSDVDCRSVIIELISGFEEDFLVCDFGIHAVSFGSKTGTTFGIAEFLNAEDAVLWFII